MCEALFDDLRNTDFSLCFYSEYKTKTTPEVDDTVTEPRPLGSVVASHEDKL
jgi:hypothetical protein